MGTADLLSPFVPAEQGQRQQEAGQELRAGLDHPQFLEHGPVAIEPFGRRLVAIVGLVQPASSVPARSDRYRR
jgi:hypothetical protein